MRCLSVSGSQRRTGIGKGAAAIRLECGWLSFHLARNPPWSWLSQAKGVSISTRYLQVRGSEARITRCLLPQDSVTCTAIGPLSVGKGGKRAMANDVHVRKYIGVAMDAARAAVPFMVEKCTECVVDNFPAVVHPCQGVHEPSLAGRPG